MKEISSKEYEPQEAK